MHLHPQGGEKIRRNLQGKFVSAPPASPGHEVHPKAEQESILRTFYFAGPVRFGGIFSSFRRPSFEGDD